MRTTPMSVDNTYQATQDESRDSYDQIRTRIDRLTVTEQQLADVEESRSIWLETIFASKLHVWVAALGVGKTTIALKAAQDISEAGYEVLYFNLDASAPDLKQYAELAGKGNYKLLAPLATGTSDKDCAQLLVEFSEEAEELHGTVFFLDTLKKFTDVINKSRSKEFYRVLRAITIKGGTVVCLAHTNKRPDADGRIVYEGTGDLKSDCDIMMMMLKGEIDGRMLVSTEYEKARALTVNHTFSINKDRTVEVEGNYMDLRAIQLEREQSEHDEQAIQQIKSTLWEGPATQTEILNEANEVHGLPKHRARLILKRYEGMEWRVTRGQRHNRLFYELIKKINGDEQLNN